MLPFKNELLFQLSSSSSSSSSPSLPFHDELSATWNELAFQFDMDDGENQSHLHPAGSSGSSSSSGRRPRASDSATNNNHNNNDIVRAFLFLMTGNNQEITSLVCRMLHYLLNLLLMLGIIILLPRPRRRLLPSSSNHFHTHRTLRMMRYCKLWRRNTSLRRRCIIPFNSNRRTDFHIHNKDYLPSYIIHSNNSGDLILRRWTLTMQVY